MDILRFAISNPVKVSVGVLLLVLAGFIALFTIPVQLVPNVDEPVITVQTRWTGIDPEQIERDILEKQEEVLKRVSGVRKMIATAQRGQGEITLEFNIGTDMTRALQEVSDKLREVPDYPIEVDAPVITVADAASQNAIAWMIITSDDPDFDVESIRDEVEDRVKPFLERVTGVSQVNVFGGREREVHVRVDPRRLAERGITVDQLRDALRNENVNVSAGEIVDGRLDRRIRTVGQFDQLEQVRQTVVVQTEGGPVRVRDLAEVVQTLEKRRSFVRSRGQRAIAMNAIREVGSNVMETMALLQARLDIVRRDMLPQLGPDLQLTQVYDETVYITDARGLVVRNLWLGGSLAIIALILYLRSVRPTVIIALAIPISVIGTFVVMRAFGRNMNVVSLAGLSFAVGMVVDNAIVVLENIDRHLGMNKTPRRAAYDAAREVWGAVLASTLTTLAVFVPVLFMQEEAGQLFRDIALAICAAVALSLITSVTVIPTAAARFAKTHEVPKTQFVRAMRALGGAIYFFDAIRSWWADTIHWLTQPNTFGVSARIALVSAFTIASIGGAYWLMPPTSYLPNGNRNLVFGMMQTPPAYNAAHIEDVLAHRVETQLTPYWDADIATITPDQVQALPPVFDFRDPENPRSVGTPFVDNFFFVSFGGRVFMGASSQDKLNVKPVEALLNMAMNTSPGAFGFAFQPPIFGHGLGGANSVEIDVVSTDPDVMLTAATNLSQVLRARYGRVNADPSNFDLPNPELRIELGAHAADLNLTVDSLGRYVQMLVDGTYVGDYRLGGKSVDILLIRAPHLPVAVDELQKLPIAFIDRNGQAGTVPLAAVANLVNSQSPEQIRRIEERRAVTLTVQVPEDVALEAAATEITQLVAELRQEGQIGSEVDVQLAGTVDKLKDVRAALLGEWSGLSFDTFKSLLMSRMFLALLVVYLLMAALFESFLYPFVIMFSVPLATVGGFAGLATLHYFDPTQQLDVLAMLGFVILIGVVVNNAILIVHQSLNFMRGTGDAGEDLKGPLEARTAIREAVRTRVRPIFMTTTTSVFGMLPLVIMPGAGSELYRGLGSVVVGGLVVAAVFTLVVVPLLLSLVIDAKTAFAKMRGVEAEIIPLPAEF